MKNEWIEQSGVIAIMRGIPMDKIIPVARAAFDGGVRIIECTYEHSQPNPCALLRAKLELLVAEFGDTMLIGAGTVLTPEQVQNVYDAGGQLIVTPNTNTVVIAKAKELGMTTAIGALTPTEIELAYSNGADYVKVFPAGDLGAGYVKSVAAPLSHIPLLAVGGITPENIPDFMKAGIRGFGIGSPLFPQSAIDAGDYAAITARAKEYCTLLRPMAE